MRVLVIGTGLFGSIIAQHLRCQGREVVTADCGKKEAGSGPAACLIKPSWLGSMEKQQTEASLSLLDQHYGVTDLDFQVGLGVTNKVHWVNPSLILRQPDIIGTWDGKYQAEGEKFTTCFIKHDRTWGVVKDIDRIIVAAGVWTFQLLGYNGAEMSGQAGQSHLYFGQVAAPFIKVWAPYKQLVGFNRTGTHIWVGDGASIKQKNWTAEYSLKNTVRCNAAVPHNMRTRSMYGVRPYVKGAKPCFMEEVRPRVWAVTGGAKNGTVAAGWAAHHLGNVL